MIEELYLKGIGGVREARLKFSARFCVITGESGSGKSSIVRALELASGRRASSNLLHGDSDEGEVILVLDLSEEEAVDGQQEPMIVRRVLSRAGRSRAYIQDHPVSLTRLEETLEDRVRIQSQFAQIELMDPRHQLALLDFFGGERILPLREDLAHVFHRAVEQEKKARQIRKKRAECEERLANAETVLVLGRGMDLTPEMEEGLVGELADTERRIELHKTFAKSIWAIRGGPGSEGISASLEGILSRLDKSCFPERELEWDETAERLLTSLQTVLSLLEDRIREDDLEDLEETRDRIQRKLGRLQKMRRLAGVQTMEELAVYSRESEKEVRWMVESVSELESLIEEARVSRKMASQLAMELRLARQEVGADLENRVNGYLGDLLMGGTSFRVSLQPQDKLRSWGAEEVCFELKGTGDFSGPVSAVASGGELSRIQLALQLCLPPERLPRSLIFDEVEAGLGGKAALQAGRKLRDLSERCQVVLVTHEAAIAALAEQHFLVERDGDGSRVIEISGERRVEEIARMLAGTENSPEALSHARALLESGGRVCEVS